ncbi:MAG: hypothetical protein B6I19_07380 [Bacteroidetes bacterium 4572_114]|nr:MAG: hypothetical protein B6I19_07380 [Bacteroidetes bacterium 4572_114]
MDDAIMEIGNQGFGLLDYSMTIQYVAKMETKQNPVEWLSVDPSTGSVPGGEVDDVSVMVNSDGLDEGIYYATIIIASNDIIFPTIEVPVTLTVNDDCPLPPPTDLEGYESPAFTVNLSWEAPATVDGAIRWDDGTDDDGNGPAQGFMPIAKNPEWAGTVNELLYYNVYRDEILIADSIMLTGYIDYNVPVGTHSWVVSAVYDECESFSDPFSLITSVNEINAVNLAMYPNPATGLVNIGSNMNITHILIVDNFGRIVFDKATSDKLLQINTSTFGKGVYFVQIETSIGTSTKKLVLQ